MPCRVVYENPTWIAGERNNGLLGIIAINNTLEMSRYFGGCESCCFDENGNPVNNWIEPKGMVKIKSDSRTDKDKNHKK